MGHHLSYRGEQTFFNQSSLSFKSSKKELTHNLLLVKIEV